MLANNHTSRFMFQGNFNLVINLIVLSRNSKPKNMTVNSLPLIPVHSIEDDLGGALLVADSRDIAKAFNVNHDAFFATIRRHLADIETESEPVIFEFDSYALLTELHATVIATYYPNSEDGRAAKVALVKSFCNARQ